MATAIPLTLHLLILIGLYDLAAGIAGLTGAIDWPLMIDEYERSPALTFVTGFAAFAIGGALHLAHHHWTDLPAIIVSAVAWIAMIEGLLIMVWAKPLFAFSRWVVRHQRIVSLIALLFGAALVLIGLTGRADATLI